MAAPLSYDSVDRHLERDPMAPVYYITGDEEPLKDEVVERIVDRAVDKSCRDFNLDVRSAGDLTAESFHALVETPPMLTERRAVVVKGIEQWRSASTTWRVVQRYLGHPSPTTTLVLTQGAGQKEHADVARAAIHVRVDALDPDRLLSWVNRRAESAGIALSQQAAEHLLRVVGNDLSGLAMEIEKLAAAAVGETIDVTDVAALVGVRRGETLQDWIDAVLLRDIPRALDMLDTVLSGSGVTGVRMVSALGTGLVGVMLACSLADSGRSRQQIRRELMGTLRSTRPHGLGNWSDVVALWVEATEAWSTLEANQALRAAYDCDRRLKSTTLGDQGAILTELLLQMIPAEAAA